MAQRAIIVANNVQLYRPPGLYILGPMGPLGYIISEDILAQGAL